MSNDIELRQLRILTHAAECCESITCLPTGIGITWRVVTCAGVFYAPTLRGSLIMFWDSALRARDSDGKPTEDSPFAEAL